MRQANSNQTAPPADSRGQRWWPLLVPAVLLLTAAAALAVDCQLAQWAMGDSFSPYWRVPFTVFEPFGQALGVLAVLLVIALLDPPRRLAIPRLLACSLGAGLAADVVKMLVVRARPRDFDFVGDVWTTFGEWLPLTSAGSSGQSLPSAHTATALGLTTALIWLYPRWRALFLPIAVLVAGHRIESGAHYLSDVLCGAALGVVVAAGCLKVGPLPKLFDRLEGRRNSSSGR